MNIYKNCVRNTLIALLGSAMLFAACEKEEEKESKSSACEIVSFSVNDAAWDVGDSTITYIYPSDTTETSLTPAITLSPGATVSPLSGVAQNFFATGGVKYTVTAEDGVTTKTYVAKATRTPSAAGSACDIVSFSVDSVTWNVGDTLITHIYPSGTTEGEITPTITLSPGATVSPQSGVAQNFFTADGVKYTVTAEDGVTKKIYTVKASIATIVASGVTGDCAWTITGVAGNYTLTIAGKGAMEDYDYLRNRSPWYEEYGADIITAVIQDGVINIGRQAFAGCSGLTSVTIPNSVTEIGDVAFEDCSGLTSITISNSLTSISVGVFRNCSSLTSITIPNSVTSISSYAFAGCSGLTSITIPNSVTSIGEDAFAGCSSLASITIPNSATYIGGGAFSDCSSLTAINANANNPNYASENGVLFNKVKTTLSHFPAGKTGSYVIPNSVTEIGYLAFAGCSGLTSVIIPNSVTSIGWRAFIGCSNLTSITIPNSVTEIVSETFTGCSNLTSITIPNSVTSIGSYAFHDCSNLTEITNMNSVPQNIDNSVFYNVDISAITLIAPSGSIDAYKAAAIWSEFIVKTNIEDIASGVTGDCTWTITGTAGNYILTIAGNGAMADYHTVLFNHISSSDAPWYEAYREDIKTVVIQDGVTNIGNIAFYGCSGLTSVTIPNSVTYINYLAFGGCSGLTSVTIPNSVIEIDHWAFSGCSSLTSVTIPNSVTEISYYIFAECSGLTSVTIPNSVTSIGKGAFSGCSGLTSVTIPNSVTSIGENAFSGCSGLTSVTIPNSVTSIYIPNSSSETSFSTFYDCSNLTAINVNTDNPNYASENGVLFNRDKTILLLYPNGKTGNYVIPNLVTEIGLSAFHGCSGLTSVTIPNSVIYIGRNAFEDCSGLTSVTIPNSVTYINYWAFGGCSGLTSITIPNSVTEIGLSAFHSCSSLTSVTIPNSVTYIEQHAFSYCGNLTEITNLNPVPQNIDGYVFYEVNISACTLRVPSGSVDAYKAADIWSEFGNIVGI